MLLDPTHGDTMCLEVLAEQELSTSAVEALVAQFGVASEELVEIYEPEEEYLLCTDSLANLKALDILTNSGNDTNGLMT